MGVGVGPGDPELITMKALHLLQQADCVLVPETEASAASGPGRAETIVLDVCPQARVRRVPFSMADRQGVTGRRKQAWLDSAAAALAAFEAGDRLVVLATIGDPSVYSTFSYLATHVREQRADVQVELVPGITAMQALAAASGTPLVEGTETLTLVPFTTGPERVAEALDHSDTVVVYKGGRRIGEVVDALRAHQRHGILGVQVGMEGERVLDIDELAPGETAPYFSTVLSAPRRDQAGGRL